MTAICLCVCSMLIDLHKASNSLKKKKGISVKTLRREREKYLFDRYCREINEEFKARMEEENQSDSTLKGSSSSTLRAVVSNFNYLEDTVDQQSETESSASTIKAIDHEINIEYPEEAVEEEDLPSEKNSFENAWVTSASTDTELPSWNASSVSGVYATPIANSIHSNLVPSEPTSPNLTFKSDYYSVPDIEEHTGKEEIFTVSFFCSKTCLLLLI